MAAEFSYGTGAAYWRPTVRLIVTSFDRVSIDTTAMLDTGADVCLFPTSLAYLLGLRLTQMETRQVAGLGGRQGTVWFDTVTLDLGQDIIVQTEVGFSSGLDFIGTGLLGQKGFFDHFKVCFDLPKRQFTIL